MTTIVATSQSVNGVIYDLAVSSTSDSLIVPLGVNLIELGATTAVLLGSSDFATVGGAIYGATGVAIGAAGVAGIRVLASGQLSSDQLVVNFTGTLGTVSNAGLISGSSGIAGATSGQTLTQLRLNNSGSIIANGPRAVVAANGSTITNSGVISALETNFGSAQAVTLSGGSGFSEIHNTGTLLSDGTALSLGFNSSGAIVYNSGLIQGGTYAMEVNATADIFNYGRIESSTYLGGANDRVFNYVGGSMTSLIVGFGVTGTTQVYNQGSLSDGISINGGGLSLENGGFIGSSVSVGSSAAAIFNTGRIDGAISTSGATSIFNSGQVVSIDTFNAVDTITNSGLILDAVTLFGGNDVYDGAQGRVLGVVTGGQGDDRLTGGVNADRFYGDGVAGDTTGGADTLTGGDGDDVLFGGFGRDTLYGNRDDDQLFGNQDDDFLHGGQGDDVIFAGQGADILNGGVGDDTLAGNAGDDRFIFNAGFGHDTITDFRAAGANDLIQFSPNTFGDFAAVQAGATAVTGGTLLTDAAGDSVLLVGVAPGALTAAMFVFA